MKNNVCNYSGFSEYLPSKNDLREQRLKSLKFKYRPLVSFIIATYNTKKEILSACLESILNQSYTNYEICISDDFSEPPETKETIIKYSKEYKNIKYVFNNKRNHISYNLNKAASLASGEYIALIDHDDILWPNALYENVKVLQKKKFNLIYSDEDQISEDGLSHVEPMYKVDWNINYLRTTNYIVHFVLVKKSLFDKVDGFKSEYDGAQDYEFLLRLSRNGLSSNSVFHINKILYSWRRSRISTAINQSVNKKIAKKYAYNAQKRALENDLIARKVSGRIIPTEKIGYYIVQKN